MDKNNRETEKSLKRFLKKKIAYTAGLLVAFLISGSVGFASSEELASQVAATQDTLISNIEAQKAEVQALLDENEARLKQLKLDTDELIRKGEWYSKPTYKQGFPGQPFPAAQQVWFSYWFEDAGKSKDNTKHEWKNTIDAIAYRASGYETAKGINPYAKGEVENGILDSEKVIPEGDKLYDVEINGNIPEGLSASDAASAAGVDPYGLLHQGNGVYINNPPWAEELNLGANIKPLSPELPVISKTVDVTVNSPDASGPVVNVAPPVVPSTPTAPTVNVSVSVTPPSPIAEINVGAVTVTPPTPPRVDKIELSEVKPPQAFEPSIAVQPEAPTAPTAPVEPGTPVIITPGIPTFSMTAQSGGNGTTVTAISTTLSNGLIEMVALKSGEFKIARTGDSNWGFEFSNYTGTSMRNGTGAIINAVTGLTNATVAYGTDFGSFTAAWQTSTERLGFQKFVNDYNDGAMLSNANFLYKNTKNSGALNEFLHFDTHGTTPIATARAEITNGSSGLSNQAAILAGFEDVVDNTDHDNTTSASPMATWINSGEIALEGQHGYITNNYDHNGVQTSKASVINVGKISVVPYKDASVTADSGNAVFGMTLDGNRVQHIMYNGENGEINVWTKGSAVFYSGSSGAGRPLTIVNRNPNNVNIYGENSAGIFVRTSSKNIFDFKTSTGDYAPMGIYGDTSIGLYNPIGTTTASDKGTFAVDIGSIEKGNQTFDTLQHNGANWTQGNALSAYDVNPTSVGNPLIEGSIGIVSKSKLELDDIQIRIFNKTEKNVGVVPIENTAITGTDPDDSTIVIKDGHVELYGGTSNYGLYATEGNIAYGGVILISDADNGLTKYSGTNNVGVYAGKGGATPDKRTVFMTGTNTDIVNSTGTEGGNTLYAATNDGYIKADNKTLSVEGKKNTGIFVGDAGDSQVDALKVVTNGAGQNVGVFTSTGGTVNLTDGIQMTGTSDTGIFVKTTTLDGTINGVNITAGTGNSGIFLADNGSITNLPTVSISGGTGNAGLFSNDYSATVNGFTANIKSPGTGNVGVFAGFGTTTHAEITLTGANITMGNDGTNLSGNNTAVFAQGNADGAAGNDGIVNYAGSLTMNMDDNGIGFFAQDDGIVNVNTTAGTINKAGAVVATDNKGIVNLNSGAVLDYDGNGYGLFFMDGTPGIPGPGDNSSTINLNSGSKLTLAGNATAIRRDWVDAFYEANNPIATPHAQNLGLSGGTIELQNDGITLFGFGNLPGTVALTDIQNVTTKIKTPLLGGALVTNGHSYKDARLFDVLFEIDEDLTINGNTGTPAEKAGDYFKNYLALQRVNLKLINPKKIDVDLAEDQLVGLALTSAIDSTTPVAVARTSITMEDGTSMTVDRTADATGASIVNKKNATGIYMNYGTVDVGQTAGATLKVNTTDPTKSEQAVGIYAENGAIVNVSTGSTVQVDGLNAIGIYGRPTRTGATEFNGTAEGIITVTNAGTVDMANADNSVGIYIDGQDPTAPGTLFGGVATNKATNNGTINTGKTDSAKSGFASGMYGSFATLDNLGQINVAESAAGIFAANGTVVDHVGNIDMADKAIGIVADKSSYDVSTALTSINVTATPGTDVSSAAGKSGTVLYLRSNAGSSGDAITNNTSITNTVADKVTNIMADDIELTNGVNQTVGDTGIGIVALNDAEVINTAQIDTTAANAIGLAATEKATLKNTGTIDFSGATANTSIGMLGSYDSTVTPTPAVPITMINEGEVKLASADNAIGIYLTSDTASAIDLTTNVNLTMNGTNLQQIGVYSLGENAIHLNATTGPATFSYANALNNILVYAKDGATIDTNGTQFTIDGTGSADGINGEKTIGIYLENAAKTNTFDSTVTPLAVTGGAIGIYSKGGNTLNLGTATIPLPPTPATPGLEVTGDTSVGAYIVGNDTISGAVKVTGTAAGNPVGIYNNGSAVTTVAVTTGIGPTYEFGVYIDTAIGTGMYATNGGYFTGDKISITNTAANTNIGVYYTKGTGTSAAHDTDIDILAGQPAVGLYADGGIALSLAAGKTVDVQADKSIAAMVGGTSTFTNNGNINLNTAVNVIGIYAVDGNGVNAAGSTITINNTDNMGLVAAADAGKTATIENAGTLAVQNGIGMVVGTPAVPGPASTGNSVGKNTGTIDVNTASGTGVVVTTGAQNTFDGTGGTINVNASAAGIYLDGTLSGQVANAGTVNLGNASAVGIFADNGAVVDFPVTVTGTQGVGVFADNGAQISGTIDASGSTGTVAVFLNTDSTVVPPHNADAVSMSGSTIKAGGANAIGLLMNGLGASGNYALDTTLEATQSGSMASAQVNSKVDSTATMNLSGGAVGDYVDAGSELNFDGTMNLGDGTIGAYIDGGIGTLGMSGAAVNFTGSNNDAIAMYVTNGGSISLGSNITTTGKGSLAATTNGNLSNSGTLTVENGANGLVGVYDTTLAGYTPPYSVSNTGYLTVKTGAIGMATVKGGSGAAPVATDVSLINSANIDVQNTNSVGLFANVGTIYNTGNMTVTDNAIGTYAKGDSLVNGLGNIDVTGATGYVYDGISAATAPTGSVTLNAGNATNRSIGGYYKDITGTIAQPTSVTVAGDYAIPLAVDGGTNNVLGNISDAAGFTNSIGMFVKNSTTTANDVTVTGAQDNIGIYSVDAALTTGTVTVGDSNDPAGDKTNSSLGVYANGGSVTTTDVTVGKDSIGLFGKNASLTANGNVTVADKAVGAYVDGTGAEAVTINGNITTGKNALGAYGKNASVNATGNMDVSNGLSIGLVGTGTGDINYNGTATVAAKGSESASIAIYKGAGQGTVNTTGTFDVHDGGYAVYADNLAGATGTITVNNGADINLDKSAVGIYAGGNVNSNNTSNITVGESYLANADHSVSNDDLNSIGMYGEEGAQLSNSGNINVGYDHSVGVYVKTNTTGTGTRTTFTNNAGATITADNGGVGVLAVQYSDVINQGTIIVNQTSAPSCGGKSVGVGVYSMSTFDNQGEVTINGGYGVFLADGTNYTNNGNMTLNNGAAVVGQGTYVNNGTVTIGGVADTSAQAGKVAAAGEEDPARNGAIAIDSQGNVVINNQYIGSGAVILDSDYDIILDNPTIDITGKPSFNANSVRGQITLAPTFITTGNGYSWTVKDFVPKAMTSGVVGTPTINTSPLFMAHKAGTDLYVAKQPYAYLVAGSQFDNLYNGVDSLLAKDQSGTSSDSIVLKQLNVYLDTIFNEQGQQAFESETDRTLAEMRGDIYSTTYKRMETIQNSFDNSFYELLNARNATKDSGKFSVIYQQGDYNDDTLGVDDYDYRVTGLMYMREVESRNYGSKYGYSVGFTVSRFDFDDAPTFGDDSKEDVYSLRAGLHNVHSFGEDGANDRLRLISRLELGYNRHEAERSIELDKLYKNKGKYNSMNVSLDNKLEGTIYRDLKTDVKVYGAINMEYGHMGQFTEKAKGDSALELTVKGQDYYSIEPEVGVDASRRAYLGKKLSAKVFGDLAYGYELGNIGDKHRKAKVNGGTEGYYNLIKPAEEKGRIKATVGVTLEKANGFGITGDVQFRKHQNKSSEDFRYGVRLNYTF